MCFSAEASFTAAGVLGMIGAFTIKQTNSKNMMYLAAVPFLFALQQLSEGILWLFMRDNLQASPGGSAAMHAYLFFAFVIWPVWTPLAFFVAETNSKRSKMMRVPLTLGIGLGVLNLAGISLNSATATVVGHSIVYNLQSHAPMWIYFASILFYIGAVLPPFFISTLKGSQYFGVFFGTIFLISFAVYTYAFASIWCFFSAISSGALYKLIRDNPAILAPKYLPQQKD